MRAWTRLTFRVWLALIGVGAFALRAGYTLWQRGNDAPTGDAVYFYGQARAVGDGVGFIDPILLQAFDLKLQAAHHPPLYVVYLAFMSKIVGTSPQSLRLASCLLGAAMVVVVGLVGRRVAGERAGLLAAAGAAPYPHLWAHHPLPLSQPSP